MLQRQTRSAILNTVYITHTYIIYSTCISTQHTPLDLTCNTLKTFHKSWTVTMVELIANTSRLHQDEIVLDTGSYCLPTQHTIHSYTGYNQVYTDLQKCRCKLRAYRHIDTGTRLSPQELIHNHRHMSITYLTCFLLQSHRDFRFHLPLQVHHISGA